MSRARELARLGNTNAISVDTSNNVGLGTTTSIQYKLDVVGDANFVGVLTATSFGGDGSALTGIAATDNLNTNNIKVSGITTLGTTSTVVGSAVTFDASGGTIVGVLTATSFEGDGSSLTGVAATDYIVSNSLKVLGISTFSGEVTAAGGVDVTGGVKSAGIVTFTNTTASTSSATGALVVSGGVGIAGSLHVGENVSVGGTLTYEDVTNVDVIGIITAKSNSANPLQITGTNDAKILLKGSNSPYITFQEASSNKAYLQWNASGYLSFQNVEDGARLRIKDDIDFSSDNGSSFTSVIHAGNVGDGEALSTKNVYVNQIHGDGSNLTNVSATASISTTASTASGIVSTLTLAKQDHKVTVSGISTFTCSGGTEGQSHTLRIVNSGITTVGFSSYFLFPSGSSPTLPTADGSVSLISFTVHRVGTPGIATQLLAGASLNLS